MVATKLHTYNVAARKAATGGPIMLMTVKESDSDFIIPLVLRAVAATSIDELDVLDIHEFLEDNKIAIIAELADWPKGVATARVKGDVMRDGSGDIMLVKSSKPTASKVNKPAADKPADVVEKDEPFTRLVLHAFGTVQSISSKVTVK